MKIFLALMIGLLAVGFVIWKWTGTRDFTRSRIAAKLASQLPPETSRVESTLTEEPHPMDPSSKPLPPIDRAVPEVLKTATLALG